MTIDQISIRIEHADRAPADHQRCGQRDERT